MRNSSRVAYRRFLPSVGSDSITSPRQLGLPPHQFESDPNWSLDRRSSLTPRRGLRCKLCGTVRAAAAWRSAHDSTRPVEVRGDRRDCVARRAWPRSRRARKVARPPRRLPRRGGRRRTAAPPAQAAKPAPSPVKPKPILMAGVDPALFKGLRVPARRAVARRTRDDGDRRAVAAGDVLHGRRQRRRVPDDRQRRDLGADHRRQDPARLDRLDRGRRLRTRTSSTSAPGRTACAATSRPAAASTRRPTAARRGQFVGLYNAGQIGARPHPSDQSRHRLGRGHAATPSRRTPSAASSRRPTAARRGRRCSSSPTASARWTSRSSPATRTSSTPGCRASSASRGRSSAARKDGGFYKSTDGGDTFTKITDAACRPS